MGIVLECIGFRGSLAPGSVQIMETLIQNVLQGQRHSPSIINTYGQNKTSFRRGEPYFRVGLNIL